MENIRVKKLRKLITESFSGSQSALSALTGISLSQLGQYLGGYRNMGEKTARKIERGANKPEGWLDKDEEAIPDPERITKNSGFIPIQIYPIQVVDWADIEKYLGGDVSVSVRTIQTTLNEEGLFAITLEKSDDSMEPEFSGGSILVVNPNKQARSGHFVMARSKQGGALTVKKLVVDADQTYLKPMNPDYKTIHAEGLVVEAVVRQLIREYDD